jgi:hypothetical protein
LPDLFVNSITLRGWVAGGGNSATPQRHTAGLFVVDGLFAPFGFFRTSGAKSCILCGIGPRIPNIARPALVLADGGGAFGMRRSARAFVAPPQTSRKVQGRQDSRRYE